MSCIGLTKAYPVRLTKDQDKAISILETKGFNRSKFIRAAINEKLHKDFRIMLKPKKETLPF